MDFDDVLEQVGSFGRYQKLILFLVLFPATLPSGFFAWNQVFMSGTPHKYHCHIPGANLTTVELINLLPKTPGYGGEMEHDKCTMYNLNYSDPDAVYDLKVALSENSTKLPIVPCQYGWEYDRTDWSSSIVTEWDLVCDKGLHVTHAYTFSGVGQLMAMMFLGFVADRYGRVKGYFLTYAIMMVFSIATAFSPNYIWFSIFRFFVGFGPSWAFTIPMIIAMEIIGPQPRALMSVAVSVYYTSGFMLLGGLSYLVNDWRPFALYSSVPMLIFVSFWWVMPESPRWLLSQNRYTDLTTFFRKVARVNGIKLPAEFFDSLPDIFKKINADSQARDDKTDRRYSALDLFRTRNLRKKTLILLFANTCNLGVYVGLTMWGPNVNRNPHWNFFLTALAEMPAYLFTSFLCDRFGRRFALVSTMVLAGLAGLAAAGVPSTSGNVIMGLVFLSKFGITIAFIVSELLEDEVFPTVVRAEGHSVTSFTSNLFTLEVPYIVYLGYEYMALPLFIFGGVCLVAAFVSLFLPETANTDLPQTLEDGEEAGRNLTWKDVFSFGIPAKRRHLDAASLLELSPLQCEKPQDSTATPDKKKT